ncbi:GTP-binding protein REM 1 isoform X4 [Dromiciops gliroides]|uniref:GTP-binding protein REM 1 isoform X4 n=1 Tax=Dromiciops gliroides TaxID=33562 RepID=UPI001CC52627|nr:GTP-binding protein REM 1 isoform X4 [Dromiciops gliroides]
MSVINNVCILWVCNMKRPLTRCQVSPPPPHWNKMDQKGEPVISLSSLLFTGNMSPVLSKMTLNTQQDPQTVLRRRASTPLSLVPKPRSGLLAPKSSKRSNHPQLCQSSSLNPPPRPPSPALDNWSSDSSDSADSLYRVVLLGDPRVGKTSLANLFAGIQDRDLQEHQGEDVYERTLSVDGEDMTLLVMDTWESEKREEKNWHRDYCLRVGSAYAIVYSITDRSSFESASELRIELRRARQADNIPIILVGNKADLVRCREVSVEESISSCGEHLFFKGI